MEMSSDDLEHADINSREEDLPLSRLIFEENRLKSIRFGYEGLPYAGQLPMEIELKFNGHSHIGRFFIDNWTDSFHCVYPQFK